MTIIYTEINNDFPISLTGDAIQHFADAKKNDASLSENAFVRVGLRGGGCSGYEQILNFDDEFDPDDDIEKTFESPDGQKISVVVDSASAQYLQGTTISWFQDAFTSGFKFEGGDRKKSTCGCGRSASYE